MAAAKRKCKVCGCEYECCHSAKRTEKVFRWQDVACSPEHGSIYLAKIEASRTKHENLKSVVGDAGSIAGKTDYSVIPVEENDESMEEDITEDEIKKIAIEM